MTGNSFGNIFTVTSFGESHGKALGVIIDGVPSNLHIDFDFITAELDRRKPGSHKLVSARQEPDQYEVLSGIYEGKTTGAPLCFVVKNDDAKPQDYDHIKHLFRPGHGDFGWHKKFGIRDHRGGGRLSGRETVARVIAGAIAKQILTQLQISVFAHTVAMGDIHIQSFNPETITANYLYCADHQAYKQMQQLLEETKNNGDSIGCRVQLHIVGLSAGLGEPVFQKLDALLAHAMLSIGGVKAISFGDGEQHCSMFGSQSNDHMDTNGFQSNHAGGIIGGLSNGQDVILQCTLKAPPSIAKPQQTCDTFGDVHTYQHTGRHDPCLVPRVIPVMEAMAAITIVDCIMQHNGRLVLNTNVNRAPSTVIRDNEKPIQSEQSLETFRQQLDYINQEILSLLNKRSTITNQVAAYKQKHHIDIFDPAREQAMVEQLLSNNMGPLLDNDIETIFQTIFSTSVSHMKREVNNQPIHTPIIIAGPCAIEDEKQMQTTYEFLWELGIRYVRAGGFKPRTHVSSFQGLGIEGLQLASQIAKDYELALVGEITDPRMIEQSITYLDVIQVGARNMYNYELLKELGCINKPVLLKRGFAATIDEFIAAANYMQTAGNTDIILCERGIRTFENQTRNTLDLSAVAILKQQTNLPIIVDLSHALGRKDIMKPLAHASLAAGSNGLMLEVHPNPQQARSDSAQQLTFHEFSHIIHSIIHKTT